MSVLHRSELEASPLADLHAIADQLGLDGFRRLRKAELIGAILGEPGAGREGSDDQRDSEEESGEKPAKDEPERDSSESAGNGGAAAESGPRKRRAPRLRSGRGGAQSNDRSKTSPSKTAPEDTAAASGERNAEGVVELLGNGSAFLRVEPPEPSDQDVYISAAQVRRCELVSGDRVTGPVRTPRRSERYPSLVRIDTINGASADEVSDGVRYDDLPAAYPSERLVFGAKDATLEAIEWLTPLGRGSRAVIVGARHAGKTETLRKLLAAVAAIEDLQVSIVLAGARPEEIAEWQEGPVAPSAALSFAASADAQGQAVEHAIEAAKRIAARGGHAVVLIDHLDGLHPHAARKALAAARNLRDSGSLTVIATATGAFGGESTVIALDGTLTGSGLPNLDLASSGTLKPELLVGEDGAKAIAQARAAALEARG
jgi:transcription termination factor Rho